MGIFSCSHEWEVRVKTFMPPVAADDSAGEYDINLCDGATLEHLERRRAGVTSVLLTCDLCGRSQTVEMLGQETP